MKYADLTYNQQLLLDHINEVKDSQGLVSFEGLNESFQSQGQSLGGMLGGLVRRGAIRRVSGGRNKRYVVNDTFLEN